ncbi:odorant receptor 131-2-like [Paralichthys olivaceus]|uniref:odorant receptor 131-2-like n=1 Tax=Paralichthys olivaceus TaxID=8255 RepID=UPI003752CDCD
MTCYSIHFNISWNVFLVYINFKTVCAFSDAALPDMNLSSVNGSFVVNESERDTFTTAVTKNVIVMVLCISINYINGTLVHTFRKHQIFNSSPRYILFIHLVINDMMQLALSTLLHIISYALYKINVPFCLILLIITIITTLNTPLNLAGMAIECYIAICIPLRHSQICTVRTTYILIGLIWAVGALSILPDLFIILVTEPLQFFHSGVFCVRDKVFRSTYSLKKRDASHIVCLVFVWFTLIYTYFRILFTAKGVTADFKKARNTILLHGFQLLLCMIVYVRPMFEQCLLYLLPQNYLTIRFSSYVIVQILPRFVSPIVYGLRDQLFRRYVTRYLLCKVSTSNNHRENVTVPKVMPMIKLK